MYFNIDNDIDINNLHDFLDMKIPVMNVSLRREFGGGAEAQEALVLLREHPLMHATSSPARIATNIYARHVTCHENDPIATRFSVSVPSIQRPATR